MSDSDKKKEHQAKADANRRGGHFQVRLNKELSEKLKDYAEEHHDGVINPALQFIVSQFLNHE